MIELDEQVTKLNSADEAERIYAAEDIGYANCVEGVAPLLARLSQEPSRAVLEAIFGGLQSIEDDAVTTGAIALLAGENSFVRNQAVELLRQRGARVIPFLERAFPNAGKNQRKMLVDVLAGVDGPGAAHIYDRALGDRDLNVVITAVESLGNAGKEEFRERIEELSATPNSMLAGACLEALAQIGNAHSVEVIRSRNSAGTPMPDFLLPSYLKLLGAQGDDECALAEATGMLANRHGHLRASILNAIKLLRQRHSPAQRLDRDIVTPQDNPGA